MEKYLDRANISNSDTKSLERIDEKGFALKRRNNEFKKLVRTSPEENEALKFYEFIEEIYKEVNGKKPRVKIRNHLPFGTGQLLLALSACGVLSAMSPFYEGMVFSAMALFYTYILQRDMVASYDRISKEFVIYVPGLKDILNEIEKSSPNGDLEKDSFMYGAAVHEVSHSTKTTKFTPKDAKSAEGIIKEIILNNEEWLKSKPDNFFERIKYLFLPDLHPKEEFDKYVRMDIAVVVYKLFKHPNSEFFNYFGEKTDELLYKVGAYIAKADPKDLIKSFKDVKEIIKTIESLEAK
jgi:hypothetical protein